MLITPERLLYLVAVAESGSFSAAGRKMGVSASAVAQVIQNMEIDLNVRLFERVSGKSPTLTEVGKAMYLQALEVTPRLQAMEKRAKAFQAGIEDKLNIAVYGFTFFPEYVNAINALAQEYPELTINMVDVEQTQSISPDEENAADIVIAPMQLKQRAGYESQTIGQLEWLFVASPAHALANRRGELSRHDLLAYKQILPQVSDFADEPLVESLRYSPNPIHCSHFYQFRALLLSGIGFAMFPAPLARPMIESGALIQLNMDFDDNQTRWPIEIAWTPSLGPAGLWFVEQFVEL
ncbi:LysR family transcriptional regulator [Vibrio sp. SCSIO 43136]|uniref:LysR family transcriptional regulator n=1 Tax=Vibrio sp. SCSIO 43136 TaxID=2819101 RepID=UPI0020750DAD|nr:LysR family transcriptional regulator [Vibrio sp. SCSIO 43136]USD67684.1 LysR family transcriptional regulator [Vibrio sp. SCSIO 43136]